MHQAHNIPWHNFSSNVTYEHDENEYTDPKTRTSLPRFILLDRPTQSGELNHFVRKFISTIHTFALTERRKYPPAHELKVPPANGLLFSTELMEKYPQYLNEKNRRLEYWTSRSASLWSLAEVVGVMLHENQMHTLLILANHRLVHLSVLDNCFLSNHSPGFDRVAENALKAYLLWNLVDAAGYLASGTYKDMELLKSLVFRHAYCSYPAASEIPHREFYSRFLDLGAQSPPDWSNLREFKIPVVHQGEGLRNLGGYLKHLFALLYRYEVLVIECGLRRGPDWENKITSWMWEYVDLYHGKWKG